MANAKTAESRRGLLASFSAAVAATPTSAANLLKWHVSKSVDKWWVTNSLKLVFTHPTTSAVNDFRPKVSRLVLAAVTFGNRG